MGAFLAIANVVFCGIRDISRAGGFVFFGRKYAFTVSVSIQGSGDRERQVTARTRNYMKSLYRILLTGVSRPYSDIQHFGLHVVFVLEVTVTVPDAGRRLSTQTSQSS